MTARIQSAISADGLADIVERVLDKGVVVAGDIAVNLVGVELLTIKLRLVLCSVDKARELGIGWWQHDPFLTGRPSTADHRASVTASQTPIEHRAPGSVEADVLRSRIEALEARLAHVTPETVTVQARLDRRGNGVSS